MDDVLSKVTAHKAVVLGPANARGERLAICQVDLLDQPALVPQALRPTTSRQTLPLRIAQCTEEQRSEIYKVAAVATRPEVAGLGKLVARCGIDATVAATIMTAYRAAHKKADADSTLGRVRPLDVGIASAITLSGREVMQNGPAHGPRTAAALVCSTLGAAAANLVVYLLGPR